MLFARICRRFRSSVQFLLTTVVLTFTLLAIDFNPRCSAADNLNKDVSFQSTHAPHSTNSRAAVQTKDDIDDERVLQHVFRPKLTKAQRTTLVTTIQIVAKTLETFNVSYHMCGGTLLGSFLHHGLIPWDDDADICVLKTDERLVEDALRHISPAYTVYKPSWQKRWKVFPSSSNDTTVVSFRRRKDSSGKPVSWRTPCLDICFCMKDSTHIWDLSNAKTKRFKLSTVFPLARRPYERTSLSAPRHTRDYLLNNYSFDQCNSGWHSHTREAKIDLMLIVPCRRLWKYYPFVFRTKSGANFTEVLKKGKTVLDSVVVDSRDSLI